MDKGVLDRQLMPPPSSLPLPLLLKRKRTRELKTTETKNEEFATFLTEIDSMVRDRESADGIEKMEEEENSNLLPANSVWKEVLDPNTRRLYYWNIRTNEVTWKKPMEDVQVIEGGNEMKSTYVGVTAGKRREGREGETLMKQPSGVQQGVVSKEKINEESTQDRKSVGNKDRSKQSRSILKINEFMEQIEVLSKLCDMEDCTPEVSTASSSEKSNDSAEGVLEAQKQNIIKAVLTADVEGHGTSIREGRLSSRDDRMSESPLKEETITNTSIYSRSDPYVTSSTTLPSGVSSTEISTSLPSVPYSYLKGDSSDQGQRRIPSETEQAQVQELLYDVYSKFTMLPDTVDPSWKFTFKVQLETRMADWSAGELSLQYFIRTLSESITILSHLLYNEDQKISQPYVVYSNEAIGMAAVTQETAADYDTMHHTYTPPVSSSTSKYIPIIDYTVYSGSIDAANVSGMHTHEADINYAASYAAAGGSSNSNATMETSSCYESTDMVTSSSQLTNAAAPTQDVKSGGTQTMKRKKKSVMLGSISHRKKLNLVDQWKKSAEVADQEEKAMYVESEMAEDNKMKAMEKSIDKWKKSQIMSGAAEKNANFIPVNDDWRNMVQRNAV